MGYSADEPEKKNEFEPRTSVRHTGRIFRTTTLATICGRHTLGGPALSQSVDPNQKERVSTCTVELGG
jgi:hypothetical protein